MSDNLRPLVEHLAPRKFSVIQEKVEGNNWMLVRGPIQQANKKNGNGRIYPREVFENAFRDPDVARRLNGRGMTGVVEHPESGQTHLLEVSHVVTKAWMEGDEVLGEMLILDTVPGTHIQKLFRAGVPVGVSSRGRGTSTMRDGAEYVEAKDFKLDTWDFVSTPSVDIAYPRMAESLQGPYRTESSMDTKLAEIMRLHVRAHEINSGISGADLKTLDRFATELIESESKINTLLGQKPDLKAEADKALTTINSARATVSTARDRVYTETAAPFAAKVQAVINPTMQAAPALAESAALLAEMNTRLAVADKRIAEMSEQLAALNGAVPSGKFAAAKRLSVALLAAKKESEASLVSMQAEFANLKKEYASAFKLLEAFIARNDEAKLARRKREALADNPALERGRELLDRCTTIAALDETIGMLSKALAPKGKKESQTAAPAAKPAAPKAQLAKVACGGCQFVTEAEVGVEDIQCPQCGKQKLAALMKAPAAEPAAAPVKEPEAKPAFESKLPAKGGASAKDEKKGKPAKDAYLFESTGNAEVDFARSVLRFSHGRKK